ncbi:hypothetical protein N7532_002323 [Penicillium argentinense]|uniref:T6SS Phospholipase effector Tle1-like catalytic domain-containing protein n=1 Tax=Penicillium argentinense TaxID=1131581 RepID=A0A9W9KLD6_9EURO|nr:uncharacterized protein N7532_002323 [Penicillium argentinense]KAJ5109678.1 hypothetical protein N7532_002323 [Penicillium argentinense]
MGDTPHPKPKQLVLCFDGTGNTFRADGTETNILKICRMLQRTDEQSGIGTEITPGSLAATTLKKSGHLGKSKTISQALGESFDQHVLGGYRFLMKHYRGDGNIYIFGFSRGAYTARFLAEMLDHAGLLGPDNEEMIPFIWESFSQWKLTRYEGSEKRNKARKFLKDCRETLCRPVNRVKFLGLFDTVNSIADFEINNDTMPSARVIRHAVSIDERRVKFQPVLLGLPLESDPTMQGRTTTGPYREQLDPVQTQPLVVPGITNHADGTNAGTDVSNPNSGPGKEQKDDEEYQDVQEIWFPGGHADIGGGFQKAKDEESQLSHVPLVWMVQEAQRAGIEFEQKTLHEFKCLENWEEDPSSSSRFKAALRQSSTEGLLHDRIDFGEGVSPLSVMAWRIMEYLPIRRQTTLPDGSTKLVHFPVHRGKAREIPSNAKVHSSAIHRLQSNSEYRPANIVVGGGGRATKCAPILYGIGEWEVYQHEGDLIRETYIRKGCKERH